jgi:hypothetical protein
MSHLLPNLVRFVRLLRGAGIPVTPAQAADLAAGLSHVDVERREDVQNAARAVLINRREHMALFDLAFDLFWRAEAGGRPTALGDRRWPEPEVRSRRRALAGPKQSRQTDAEQEALPEARGDYSAIEILRYRRFEDLSAEEMAILQRLIRAMPWRLPLRRTRRRIPALHGVDLDWRRTRRRSWRFGGEPLALRWRQRRSKPRPVVVLCDVSGSMAPYSRLLLQFIYALGRRDQAEAFVFSTRLSRITPHLRRRGLNSALAAVSVRVSDMGGGTQIGQALKSFNQAWARRVLGRGAIVILISDGWDRGDPEEIRRQMDRLHRSSYRLIWLNPLLGSPDYQPLTRGMQAALPFVDHFLPIHNLHSLEQLAVLFAGGR